MTKRRDRNHDARRLAAAFAVDYMCPDCHADKNLTETTPGVFVLEISHDETCPQLRRVSAPNVRTPPEESTS
ncbi:MAG: hypothetical protein M3O28_10925 [Actinomycetota bacterium]|nr:hypothetical protein [Actinomycetota bacterium]